ncbi:hypothetical protein FQR65_LT01446 [Abscondita terminalis]|nr:hypothetical protein FQR65_LT01446 [Abscondita terminalis]
MSEIIKKWITNCIGLVMNTNPDVFAAEVMDGTIIAQILHSYNIISDEQRLRIIPTNNCHVAFQNLKHIRHWLKTIGVDSNEEDMTDISREKCGSAVKLFYQIYLTLQDKDELYYTAQKRANERLHPTDTKFEVVTVNETTETDFVSFTDHPYSEQLVLKNGVIEWNKSRYETLTSTYEALRERYTEYLQQKFALKPEEKFEKIPTKSEINNIEELNEAFEVDSKDYTAEELIKQSENNAICPHPNPQVASMIVDKLKKKRKEAMHANDLKLQQQRLLLMELWNQILTKQEKDLENSIASKILRQSMFEKQMSTKMFEREEEFLDAVFLRDKSTADQKNNYYFEKYRIMELHRRIYAEKQRLKVARRKKLCSDIVDDLIDLSLKYYTYKDMYKEEPDERVLKQWGNLFVKSKSIFPYVEDLTEIVVDVGVPEGMEEIYLAEIERQDALDEREFEKYLNYEWPWNVENLLIDYELGMNVLGHNVHRVLYAKYPGPKLIKPDLPPVDVAACVNSMPNLKMLPALQKLLKKRRVKVIEIQEELSVSIGDLTDLEYRDPLYDLEKRNEVLRKSRLLPNPTTPIVAERYDTYLTAYIRIKHERVREEEEDEDDFEEPPLEEFYLQQANDVITANEAYFKPKKEKSKGKKDKNAKEEKKSKKVTKKGKKTKDKSPEKENQLPTFEEPEEDVKEAKSRIFEEWRCCVLGEYQRASTRVNTIKEKGLQDVDSILGACQKRFHALYDQIRERYQTEMNCVNTACEVLARAVEAEIRLQPQLILEDDKFYVDPNVLLFPNPPPKPDEALEEYRTEDMFTIDQLENFSNILARMAPQGSIIERSFVFVLQDVIVLNAEDGKKPIVPKLWRKLQPHHVPKLSKILFGDVEFIEWRDFIINNMQLPYPTIDQLLRIRSEFLELDTDSTEMVKYYEFYSIRLWFEDSFDLEDPRQLFRLTSIKELLFKLYKADQDNLNYTALLLDFCKDENAVDGFTKALALVYGKEICGDPVLGELYVSNVKEQRFLDEQASIIKQLEHEELLKCTESVLSSLINTTVHTCDSVVIESYHSGIQPRQKPEEQSTTDIQDIYTNEFGDTESCSKSEFSNVEIGFQPEYNKNYIYLLQFEVVFSILTVTLPWHAKAQTIYDKSVRQKLEGICQEINDPFFNDNILAHRLLNDNYFKDMMSRFFKFIDKNPLKIVHSLLENN